MFWWSKYRSVYEKEIAELKGLGLDLTIDTSGGLLQIQTMLEIGGERVNAEILYPHSYPYFPAMVNVPGLDRPRHYERAEGNLCLLGRSTRNWDPSRTVADQMIRAKLSDWEVLSSAIPKDEGWVEKDDEQAEPASALYSYLPDSAILVSENFRVDGSRSEGHLLMGFAKDINQIIGKIPIQAVILSIVDNDENFEDCFDSDLQRFYSALLPVKIRVPWIRLAACPPLVDGSTAYDFLKDEHPAYHAQILGKVKNGQAGLIACVAPQEVRQGEDQDGWFFIGWSIRETHL